MSKYILEFETPLKEIEEKIDILKTTSVKTGMDVSDGIKKLKIELDQKKKDIYSNLTRWDKVQIARHPKRPYSSDFIELMIDDWLEFHGDRYFADDPAMICGIGRINNDKIAMNDNGSKKRKWG